MGSTRYPQISVELDIKIVKSVHRSQQPRQRCWFDGAEKARLPDFRLDRSLDQRDILVNISRLFAALLRVGRGSDNISDSDCLLAQKTF